MLKLTFSKFHVDNLSSAHVYLRLKTGDLWTSIPKDLLEDCAQLTKANSIEGEMRLEFVNFNVNVINEDGRQ